MGVLSYGRPIAVLIFSFCLLNALPARAQSGSAISAPSQPISPYVISDLLIDVTAENAVKAREKAFAEALMRSYTIMVERLLPNPADRTALRAPDATELGRLLADFATKNEQLGPTRYAATFEMRFKPGAVQSLISAGGGAAPVASSTPIVPSSIQQTVTTGNNPSVPATVPQIQANGTGDNVLILPFYQPGAHPVLWSGVNPLREALQRANLQDTKIKAPLGDLEDIQAFDESHTLNYAPEELAALLSRYEARDAIVAIAVPDGVTDAAGTQNKISGLSVLLYRASNTAPQPQYLQALSVPATGLPSAAAVYTRAIDKIRAMLPILLAGRDDVAAATPQPVAPEPVAVSPDLASPAKHDLANADPQSLQARARFRDLQEWQQMRAHLNGIPGLQTVRVMSLKTLEARLELIYTGADTALLDGLKGRGFETSVSASEPDLVEPAAGTPPSTGLPVVYDLTYNPWLATGGQVIKP